MIYLDYASTTPIRQEVLQAYEKILKSYYANADSLHQTGRKVQSLLETSRANIAQLFHVREYVQNVLRRQCGHQPVACHMGGDGPACSQEQNSFLRHVFIVPFFRYFCHGLVSSSPIR